jgi:catechol 2,3-dioxygenase-like lactoylglutathione lyase family enzyme
MTVPFSPITHLRHVAMAVPDYDAAVEFYGTLWGLERVVDDTGLSFWGTPADPEQYILRLRKDPNKRLDLVAFGARSAADVDSLGVRLLAAGVKVDREPHTLATPGGGYGIRFFDPTGLLIEVSADVAQRPFRALEDRESIPQKLSHVVLNSPDPEASSAFFAQHLGLRVTDWLANVMCFMRSGPQHHVVGFGRGPHASLNHVSFEMRGIDEYMRGSGRLIRSGNAPLWGPGRHGPGDNTFSYFLDPNRNIAEYTTSLQLIDDEDNWKPSVYGFAPESQDQWGTAGPINPNMMAAQANDPDTGLWTSSPV